ncbi:MAG: hypothetical protein R3C11_10245 [Planctomycetaceae bacterium]
MFSKTCSLTLMMGILIASCSLSLNAEEIPVDLQKWLQPQEWQKDTDGPILSLGEKGYFDDTHVLAPCVVKMEGKYYLWYNGSTGTVKERVFNLGLATSADGVEFKRYSEKPVFEFGDGKHSILTTSTLRETDGTAIKDDGKLRMWFSSTYFTDPSGYHGLYETTSTDGIHWTAPQGPQLDHVYAPSIMKEGETYRMWYTDVSQEPWLFRTATSQDGTSWKVYPEPILKVDQDWEQGRLFYPYVMKVDGVYLMWYGSYWAKQKQMTAIGIAASTDGITWYKNPHNPVVRPQADRPWESHYNTSQSVVRNEDGSFRIWYASRKAPPHVNKYFALGTATWEGLEE